MGHVSKMISLFHLFIGINKSGGANYQSTGRCRYNTTKGSFSPGAQNCTTTAFTPMCKYVLNKRIIFGFCIHTKNLGTIF